MDPTTEYVLLVYTMEKDRIRCDLFGTSTDAAMLHQVGASMAKAPETSYRVEPLQPVPV